jgi:lipoprotein LpqH
VWNRFAAGLGTGLMVVGIGACSSPPPAASPQAGTLPSGTAQVTIDNKDIPRTYAVHCTSIESLRMIATGDVTAGATALVSNKDALTAQSVGIQDLGGFTGSYMEGLQGRAQVTMSGQTYTIRGTAEGFDTDNPSARTTGTFVIKVACEHHRRLADSSGEGLTVTRRVDDHFARWAPGFKRRPARGLRGSYSLCSSRLMRPVSR